MSGVNILNYELAPSPATIFGCLLPAPWLGLVAGLLLAFGSASGLPDRFAPLTLAVTHSLVLGMLMPVMIGALFQLMPVVAGQTVAAARYISPFVAIGSALIAAGLASGFLSGYIYGFMLAAGLAFVLYSAVVCALLHTAWRISVVDATTRTLRWTGVAIAMVVGIGIALAGNFAGWWSIDVLHWLNLHVAWGLVGLIATLVLGVGSTTVPMFWQSARPSARWQRVVPAALWIPLVLATPVFFWQWALLAGCAFMLIFASIALRAIWRARRRFDPAWQLWLVSAASWATAALLTGLYNAGDSAHSLLAVLPVWVVQAFPWWIGVLVLVGGAVLPVNAMMGKIIPFLVFLHLRRQTPAGRRVPAMQVILPPQRLLWQARLVLLALLLLLLLPLAPMALTTFAGLVFAASQGLLGALMLMTLFRYRRELHTVLMRPEANNIPHIPQKN